MLFVLPGPMRERNLQHGLADLVPNWRSRPPRPGQDTRPGRCGSWPVTEATGCGWPTCSTAMACPARSPPGRSRRLSTRSACPPDREHPTARPRRPTPPARRRAQRLCGVRVLRLSHTTSSNCLDKLLYLRTSLSTIAVATAHPPAQAGRPVGRTSRTRLCSAVPGHVAQGVQRSAGAAGVVCMRLVTRLAGDDDGDPLGRRPEVARCVGCRAGCCALPGMSIPLPTTPISPRCAGVRVAHRRGAPVRRQPRCDTADQTRPEAGWARSDPDGRPATRGRTLYRPACARGPSFRHSRHWLVEWHAAGHRAVSSRNALRGDDRRPTNSSAARELKGPNRPRAISLSSRRAPNSGRPAVRRGGGGQAVTLAAVE